MLPMIDIKRAAAIWSISERRVNELCKTGRIEGAVKENGRWSIPQNTRKPADKRYKSSPLPAYSTVRKPLPIGISRFKRIAGQYYFVDKTMLIKEIIDEKVQVSLFTRPRSFGKSVNLDMLRTFFELSNEDTTAFFTDKEIWKAGTVYRMEQGRYPAINLDFKEYNYATWENGLKKIEKMISDEYSRFRNILPEGHLAPADADYFGKMLEKGEDFDELVDSIYMLTKILHEYFGQPAVITIDEYDTPLSASYEHGYYNDAKIFFRMLYERALNDNPHLAFCFIAGIKNPPEDGIFAGVRSIKINNIAEKRYGKYFGFTREEVLETISYFNVPQKEEDIRKWYASYRFGDTEVYNPWSVNNYLSSESRALPYWEVTGNNDIINDFLTAASLDMLEKLESMMQGKSFRSRLDFDTIYPNAEEPESFYSSMLVQGYLKAINPDRQMDGDYMSELAIPNREISYIFGKKILAQYEPVIPRTTANAVRESIYLNDIPRLKDHISELIRQTIAFNLQGQREIFYHGMLLGLCALLGTRYYIGTERENGTGNFSIEMMPLETRLPGILIMVKESPYAAMEQMDALARFAGKQIVNKQYDSETKVRYVRQALKYGVAYSGGMISVIDDL